MPRHRNGRPRAGQTTNSTAPAATGTVARAGTLTDPAPLAERMAEIEAEVVELQQDIDSPDTAEDDRATLVQRSNTLLDEHEELAPQLQRAQRLAVLGEHSARNAGLNGFSGADTGGAADGARSRPYRDDPWASIQRAGTLQMLGASDMLARSEAALDVLRDRHGVPDEGIQRLAGLLDPAAEGEPEGWAMQRRSAAAELVLAAGHTAYRSAFLKIVRDPIHFMHDLTEEESAAFRRTRAVHRGLVGNDWRDGETVTATGGPTVQRAALSLTAANGGYLVPLTLDPSVILTNAGSANPWRAIADIKRTPTNTWQGVNSAGMNAAWLAEAGVVGDNSPTFGQTVITPQKAAVWAFGSYEVLEDSEFATQLPVMLEDAKDRLEENAFAIGDGVGKPVGAVTRATTVALGGGVVTAAGVYSTHQALPARFRRGRTAWVGNIAVLDALRQLPTYTGSQSAMVVGNRLVPFDEPVYESSSMDGVIATGGHKVLLYLDGASYFIVDRIGMSVMYEPMIKDPTTGRPTGQGGWLAFWRTGGDSSVAGTSGAIRVLSLT